MPLFGKKKDEGADIEAAEEEGLLMAAPADTAPAAPAATADPGAVGPPTAEADSAPADPVLDEELSDAAEAALADVSKDDPNEASNDEDGEQAEVTVPAPEEEGEGGDDLMSMFSDSESYGDLAELTKDLEDIPAAELLAELREIRSMLPADALEDAQQAA